MRYAAMTSCTDNYKQWLNALLNSLDYYGHTFEVHVIAIDMDPEYMERAVSAGFSFPLMFHRHTLGDYEAYREGGKNIMSKKARYEAFKEFIGYDAFVLLDADMFCVKNITPFLDLVAGTDLVIGCNERFKWNLGNYRFENRALPAMPMSWMICNAPLFFSPLRQAKFMEAALAAATGVLDIQKDRTPSDLFCMNVALHLAGITGKVIALPHYCWTGVHQGYVDMQSRIRTNGNGFVSRTGEPVWMIHGRWREDSHEALIRNMEKKWNELKMPEAAREKERREVAAVVRAIRDKFEFFNTEHKLKLKEA